MTIIDCTLGFNEIELFTIRFKELNDIVGRFLIVEATHTHSGNPKPLYFTDWYNSDPTIDYSRIEIITWDNSLNGDVSNAAAWIRENRQREIIGEYLTNTYTPDTIAMLSDMDEIPKGLSLQRFLDNGTFEGVWRFEQDLSYLYFNANAGKWCGTKIFHVSDIDHSQYKPMTDLIRYRPESLIAGTIKDGGWHFSSVGGLDRVRTKMISYAHTEQKDERTLEDIQDSLDRLVDPFHKNPLTILPIETLPVYVQLHADEYTQFIVPVKETPCAV